MQRHGRADPGYGRVVLVRESGAKVSSGKSTGRGLREFVHRSW